jgi:transposase
MAAKRLPMNRLREMLRLKAVCDLGQKRIAQSLRVGAGTVSEYLAAARKAGIDWAGACELSDEELEARVFGEGRRAMPRVQLWAPDWAEVHREMRRPGVTLQLLWSEYRERNAEGYRYSRFCELYGRYVKTLTPTMRQVHRAGEKVFVDFSGKKPSIVDRETGEMREVELFVGTLGASGYAYAEAVLSQDLPTWIDVHVRMVEEFGGVPSLFVPDNLKSAVTKACRYEPELTRAYEGFVSHYGAAALPARAYRPRDKAKVEGTVLLVQRWVLAALRNRTFFSLAELNEAIREKVAQLNERPMKKLGVSRRELYERLEKPALKALPQTRYEMAEWKACTVNIDYHVEYDRNFYSVPYQLVGAKVEVRATRRVVEVVKGTRVASHARLYGRGRYSTLAEHRPASHRAHAEWTPSRLIAWGEKTGPATGRVVAKILEMRPHPEQGYRSCLGLLRLSKQHGTERLEKACALAERLSSCSYKTVKNILMSGRDRMQEPTLDQRGSSLPAHENIRGASYYGEGGEKEVLPC